MASNGRSMTTGGPGVAFSAPVPTSATFSIPTGICVLTIAQTDIANPGTVTLKDNTGNSQVFSAHGQYSYAGRSPIVMTLSGAGTLDFVSIQQPGQGDQHRDAP